MSYSREPDDIFRGLVKQMELQGDAKLNGEIRDAFSAVHKLLNTALNGRSAQFPLGRLRMIGCVETPLKIEDKPATLDEVLDTLKDMIRGELQQHYRDEAITGMMRRLASEAEIPPAAGA